MTNFCVYMHNVKFWLRKEEAFHSGSNGIFVGHKLSCSSLVRTKLS
jgi:hypothetical protein